MFKRCDIAVVLWSVDHPDYMEEAVVRITGFRIARVRITDRPLYFQVYKSMTRIQLQNKLKGPYFETSRLFAIHYE